MVRSLPGARIYAEKIRFSGDRPSSGAGLPFLATVAREAHYQDAVEISAALTPILWERLLAVCERLEIPREAVVAFIYSSPQVQAECVASGGEHCTIRFSSAMLDLLSEDEFEFVIGHEIGHFLLNHQPVQNNKVHPQIFLQLRSQEISADRIGLRACGSLEIALRALMKTISGLTEKHLRFDVAAFIAQLRKIEGLAPDWSGATHPSIIVRAKALLWLSMTGFLHNEREEWSAEEKGLLDQRVERDLARFVDGAIKKRIDETKSELLLWMMTYEIAQKGSFTKSHQLMMREMFGDDTMDRLLSFVGSLDRRELDEVVYEKVRSARMQLESLIPQGFEVEIAKLQSKVEDELRL